MTPPRDAASSIDVVPSVDLDEWDEFLRHAPAATPFHDPRFVRLFADCRGGAEPRYLELRGPGGELLAGLPFVVVRRGPFCALVSGPGGSYGGPAGGEEAHRRRLIEAFLRHREGVVVRREFIGRQMLAGMESHFRQVDRGVLLLEDGFEEFERNVFPRNRRNECTRSERRGLVVEWDSRPAYVEAVHRIYAERSRQWSSRALPLDFWRRLLQELPNFLMCVAIESGEVVGGHLCCRLDDELFAWVGTTLRRERTYPSAMLIREEARFAATHGLGALNLGASDGLSGVAGFKKLLGASTRPQWHLLAEPWPLRVWRRIGRGVR